MNLLDRKILSMLDRDSRIQSSALAKKLKTSRQVIDYRIQQLQKRSELLHCITLVDPFQFVNNIWHTYVKLQSLTSIAEKELTDFLNSKKQIWWFANCQGEWDLIFSTASNNIADIDFLLQEFRSKFSLYIAEEQTTSLITSTFFPRGYFTEEITNKQRYAQLRERQKIDKTDKKILRILSTEARLPATEIARKTKLTARQVIYRIKELRKKEVIRAFKIQPDLDRIHFDYYKVCFFTQQFTKEIENKIISWCEKNPYTINFIRKMAPWTFEIEFETPSYKTLNQSLIELKNSLGNIIKRTQTTTIIKEFKGELNILESISE